jgi:hypothetical protein
MIDPNGEVTSLEGGRECLCQSIVVVPPDPDPENPSASVCEPSFSLLTSNFITQPSDVWASNDYVCVCAQSSFRVYTFDGSSFSLFDTFAESQNFFTAVWGKDDYIYVGNNGSGKFRIFKIDAVLKLQLKAEISYADGVADIHGYNNYIFVAVSDGGNFSDGPGLFAYEYDEINGILSHGYVGLYEDISYYSVFSDETYVYAGYATNNLGAYSFNGSALSHIKTTNIGAKVNSIWSDGSYIYVATSNAGLKAYTFDGVNDFDEQSVVNPVPGANGHRVRGDGKYIYFSQGNRMYIYTFNGNDFSEVTDTSILPVYENRGVFPLDNYVFTVDSVKLMVSEFEQCCYTGTGTIEDPILICEIEGLQAIGVASVYSPTSGTTYEYGTSRLSLHYKLINDIGASDTINWNGGAGFLPIGISSSYLFTGSIDGNYKTINNLFINRPTSNCIGLIGCLASEFYIKNLILTNLNITGKAYCGGLVGVVTSGTIDSVMCQGTINGATGCYSIGGLVGDMAYNSFHPDYLITVNKCLTDCIVSSVGYNTGGIVGKLEQGILQNSYALNSVTGGAGGTGGAIGVISGYAKEVNNIYSTGIPTGSTSGGLAGVKAGGISTVYNNCFWDTVTSGIATSVIGSGETTTNMKIELTFVDWNFADIWAIDPLGIKNNGYPYLQWAESLV